MSAGGAAWTAHGLSDIGLVRQRNEDAFAVDEALGCCLVADGLGGHRGGDVASALARDRVLAMLGEAGDALAGDDAAAALERAVQAANKAILHTAASDPSLAGMGTTLSLVWLDRAAARAWIAHVGDSRVYRLGEGGLEQLTDDHTVGMELVRAGAMSASDAERSMLWHQLTRAVGLDADLAVDVFAVDTAGARAFLVCSDGLTGMVGDDTIARLLEADAERPEAACRVLVDAAIDRGGHDNVTVVVLAPPAA